MTTAQVIEMLVTVNNKSPIQDCVHPDDQTQPSYKFIFWGLNCKELLHEVSFIHSTDNYYGYLGEHSEEISR